MENTVKIPLKQIVPSAFQPRKKFDEESIMHLSESIKEIGLIQPIVVREKNGSFELIAGERRVEAAKIAGLKSIPAIVRNLSDLEAFQMAFMENMERENLNPIEIAESIKRLKKEFALTDEKIGALLNMSRPQVTNYLRLLNLPHTIKKALVENEITMGHAKSMLTLKEKDAEQMLKHILDKNLSVRETEQITRREKSLIKIEELLMQSFGTKVEIHGTKKKGKIEIHYFCEDDLIRIIRRIK
ncbi:MAG: ParB/RepB/Spo0J family partition protein [Caldisericaceae bacterium]|nr:ParB/RepB/Spo0J family partition protein [Caldisericaceae bacterium]